MCQSDRTATFWVAGLGEPAVGHHEQVTLLNICSLETGACAGLARRGCVQYVSREHMFKRVTC